MVDISAMPFVAWTFATVIVSFGVALAYFGITEGFWSKPAKGNNRQEKWRKVK